MTHSTDGSRRSDGGLESAGMEPTEHETMEAVGGPPSQPCEMHRVGEQSPRPVARDTVGQGAPTETPGQDGGLVEREAARALAALQALHGAARFGRERPEVASRLAAALTMIDEALAEAVRELYGKSGETEG